MLQESISPALSAPTITPPTLRLIQCSAAHLDDPNHHLRWKRTGYWQLRITVIQNQEEVGRRVIVGLKTRCVETARKRRDRILAALAAAGLIHHLSLPTPNP